MNLTDEEKREILGIARRSLETYLAGRGYARVEPKRGALSEKRGAFVTLEKHGDLRGCIGRLVADRPLFLTVQEMAIQAATGDPRFSSVRSEELPDIEIEVSVLSPMEKLSHDRLEKIRIGEHGLMISQGHSRGLLLPQVASREGWNRETFLSATCRKAGLPADSWRSPETTIEVFTADVFSEKDFRE